MTIAIYFQVYQFINITGQDGPFTVSTNVTTDSEPVITLQCRYNLYDEQNVTVAVDLF